MIKVQSPKSKVPSLPGLVHLPSTSCARLPEAKCSFNQRYQARFNKRAVLVVIVSISVAWATAENAEEEGPLSPSPAPPAPTASGRASERGASIGLEAQSQSAATNSIGEKVPALPAPEPNLPKSTIWQSGIGEGFLPTAQTFNVEAGVALGMAAFGSLQAHDLALLSLTYGHMLGHLKAENHWYRGNFEGRLELFGGGQYSPSSEWVIGLTPHLRYNFATGTCWVPFLDGGAGVTATGIGPPDIGGTFEFNLQGTSGVHWFVCDNLALTGEVRYMHMSCAGIHHPNRGLNNVAFMTGVTWFFGK